MFEEDPQREETPQPQRVYQEYPRMMYHQTQGHKVVQNELEEKQLGKEWQRTPFPPAPPVEEIDPVEELRQQVAALANRVKILEGFAAEKKK